MTRRRYRPTQRELDSARWYLMFDLTTSARQQRERAVIYEDKNTLALAAAERLEELAASVPDVSAQALADYAKARRIEEKTGNADFMHCSITSQIGFAINPQTIDDLCRVYACAVECFRHSPFAENGSIADFWDEFLTTAHVLRTP